MACAYKFEVRRFRLTSEKESEVDDEQITVSIMADLQELQDKESEGIMSQLQDKVSEKRERKMGIYFAYHSLTDNIKQKNKNHETVTSRFFP